MKRHLKPALRFAAMLSLVLSCHLVNIALAVVLPSGNGNTSDASLQSALQSAGEPSLPFFGNIGLSSTGNASVTYLGNRWAITAGHETIANVVPNAPGGVSFGGNHFNVDESTITYLNNINADGSLADLKLFRLTSDPGLPAIAPALISSTAPTGLQIMIGNGRNLDLSPGAQQFWNVDMSQTTWQWTSESQPLTPGPNDFSGFNITGGQIIRWGQDNVEGPYRFVHTADDSQNHPLKVQGYTTKLDDAIYTGTAPLPSEAGGSNGDSGGGVFALVNGQWQLSGIMVVVFLLNNQPTLTSVFGEQTFIADLRQYRDEILTIVPEPSSLVPAATAAAVLVLFRRRKAR
ncbi:MAG: hypothetical protein HY288_14420 [Planctomycetia bacterium]|nr:hypothetical protein [Planctomycetia bacterium]